MTLREELKGYISEASGSTDFVVEYQEKKGFGDYSTNVALVIGKKEGKDPMIVAEEIVGKLDDVVAEVAKPGFINITVDSDLIQRHIKEAKKEKKGKASVEFISANPTGPLHIGNARGGPIGDTIANVLERVGYTVKREYLHNDAGAQVGKFKESLRHWYTGGGENEEIQYQGDYIKELVKSAPKDLDEDKLLSFAFDSLQKENFATIKDMGIEIDKVTADSDLLKGKTQDVIKEFEKKGFLEKKDGAMWFKMENPAVVVKSDGTPVYFANDIAYHKEKFSKNDVVVDILGEGHHGHIPKLNAIAEALEFPLENFHILVHGQVSLMKKGESVKMSKREGNFVTAREVLDEVGKDAFRYFLLSYSPRTAMKFDIDLAKERSKKNPVYYVQYAHARACSVLNKSEKKPKADWNKLTESQELNLLRRIVSMSDVVNDTAHDFEVQRLTHYAYSLAKDFTAFYENVRVSGEAEEGARLALVDLAKTRIADILGLMGISAPENM